MAISLNGSNTYGFLKCKFGSNQGITSMASDYFKKQMFKSVCWLIKLQSNSLINKNNF